MLDAITRHGRLRSNAKIGRQGYEEHDRFVAVQTGSQI